MPFFFFTHAVSEAQTTTPTDEMKNLQTTGPTPSTPSGMVIMAVLRWAVSLFTVNVHNHPLLYGL